MWYWDLILSGLTDPALECVGKVWKLVRTLMKCAELALGRVAVALPRAQKMMLMPHVWTVARPPFNFPE